MSRPIHRRWFRFSLQSLLLLMAIIAAVNWAWLEKRNADQYRLEAERLRRENAAIQGREETLTKSVTNLARLLVEENDRDVLKRIDSDVVNRMRSNSAKIPEHWLEPEESAPSPQPMD